MAKVYDPILCMMVDEPAKVQDAKAKDKLVKVPDSKLKDFEASLRSSGFKVVSKSDRGKTTHYQVEVSFSKQFTEADLREWAYKIDAVCDKMSSVAPTTWNIGLTVDGKITAGLDVREMYVKDSAKVADENTYRVEHSDVPGSKRNYSYIKANSENEAANKVKGVVYSVKKVQDSASVLDKAIKTADGMFASAFGEYSKGAKFKKDKFLKELSGITDAKEFAQRMQTLDNELRKNLERLDEAYNVAGKDYYAARNEIRSIMDAFSSEAFSLYKKLGTK